PHVLAEAVLVSAGDMGVRRFFFELQAVELPPTNHPLLSLDGKRFPCGGIVNPLLQEQDRASSSGTALRNEDQARRIVQRRILGSIDEAGQIAIVAVGPARGFGGNRR